MPDPYMPCGRATPQTACGRLLPPWIPLPVRACHLNGSIARGGHGFSKVSPGPAMPYRSTHCGWPPLKQPFSYFMGCSCFVVRAASNHRRSQLKTSQKYRAAPAWSIVIIESGGGPAQSFFSSDSPIPGKSAGCTPNLPPPRKVGT
jgi:hypothetical protein